MRNKNYEQQTVDQVMARIPEAGQVLRSYGINPTSRLTLSQAAAATSSPIDEVLAIMEFKARRAAQRPVVPTERPVVYSGIAQLEHEEVEEDAELVA